MERRFALGLDVSKRTIDVCLLGADGKRQSKQVTNCPVGFAQLVSWLHGIEPASIHACLEPTGKYSREIALFLHRNGYTVSQVNSYAVLHHGRSKMFRNKNDQIDGFLLADYCFKERPPTWIPVEQSLLELRQIAARISDLDEMLRQEQNRLEAKVDSALVREQIEQHIVYLTLQKEKLETAAIDVVQGEEVLKENFKILSSIIGIGKRSAVRLLSLVNFEAFENPRDTGCFAGLTPRQHRSGTSIRRHENISRVGSQELRGILYFPAMVAMQHNPQMRSFAERLRAKGKPPKLIICAVMRKLLVLSATLVRRQTLYDPRKGLIST